MLHVRLPGFQLVKLGSKLSENVSDARVVGKHHATDLVLRGYIGTLLCKCDLNRSWTPRDEVGKLSLSDSL